MIKQSQTARSLNFLMIDSADYISGKTGLSPTVTISKNGGSFAAPAGAVTEIGNGWYKVAGNASDSDTLGQIILHAEAPGAIATDETFMVVPWDPYVANLPVDIQKVLGQDPTTDSTPIRSELILVNGQNATASGAVNFDDLASALTAAANILSAVGNCAVPGDAMALVDNAITSNKITDGAITAPKITDGAITSAKLADGAITAPKITDGAITSAKLADGALAGSKIADGAITSAKFTVNSYSGAASGIIEKLDQIWRRFFRRVQNNRTTDEIITYADDGTTVMTTQSYTDNDTVQDITAAS